MQPGTLDEQHLSVTTLKMLEKKREKQIGPGIGNDYSLVKNIISTEGIGATPYAAWYKAFNNFSCSMGTPMGARIVSFYPKQIKTSIIKSMTMEFEKLENSFKVPILGGHTEIVEDLKSPKFIVNLCGYPSFFVPDRKNVKCGTKILLVGKAAILGTNLLVENYYAILKRKFTELYLEKAMFDQDLISIQQRIYALRSLEQYREDIYYIHDVSSGGVYGALWQMGKWANKGFMVQNKKISIKQETIEICETLNCNPYLLDGTGAFIVLCNNGREIAGELMNAGIEAEVIGEINSEKERQVMITPDDIRTLAPVSGDSFYDVKV